MHMFYALFQNFLQSPSTKAGSTRSSSVVPENMMMAKTRRQKMMISRKRIVQLCGRVFLPSLTMSFVFVYFIAAIYLYNNPTIKFG